MKKDKVNELRVDYNPNKNMVRAGNLFQYDYGQVLYLAGFPLQQVFEAHFSHEKIGDSIAVIGSDNRVWIPDMFLTSGKPIYVWLYIHEGADDGRTLYEIMIPVAERSEITSEEPTPVEYDLITEAIAVLNNAVEETSELKAEIETLLEIFDPGSDKDSVIVDAGTTADIIDDETAVNDDGN